jgi:hypothetical protein
MTTAKFLFIISIILLCSCSKKVKVFKINDDVVHITLTLFDDSTFVEDVHEIEASYEYSGIWTGNLSEDSLFTTTKTRSKFNILTLTPTNTYKIKNGEAVPIID